MKYSLQYLSLYLLFFLFSCSTAELLPEQLPWSENINDPGRILGASNALKKAYQMANVVFYPRGNFSANNSNQYSMGKRYEGLVYSSTKEINTYIGEDISFQTFMTAVNNVKSKLYTEKLNESPYHGVNCRAYYGTVCSGLVNYALGLKENIGRMILRYGIGCTRFLMRIPIVSWWQM